MGLDIYLYKLRSEPLFERGVPDDWMYIAKAAGVCDALWYPEQNGICIARQLIPILTNAIAMVKSNPKKFNKFGRGGEDGKYTRYYFTSFMEGLLMACKKYPESQVEAWR